MDVAGVIFLHVDVPRTQNTYQQKFYVVENNNSSKILLGRDFMEKFGVISFDFTKNRVKLGNTWINGAVFTKDTNVRLHSKCTIPRRSESILSIKSNPKWAFIPVDFEPRKIPGVNGLYISHSRVLPNVAGEMCISVLNVTEMDIQLHPRTRIGKITEPQETLRNDHSDAKDGSNPSEEVSIEESLDIEERNNVKRLLDEFKDVFAINPKKPKRVVGVEHHIVTGSERPVFLKPRKIPNAWKAEVDNQVNEMLQNDIIRPSSSPWNSPILLIKKKDNSTRFVSDFRGLNDVTKKDRYPLPNITEMIDRMQGAIFWSKFDAASAYWSMNLREEDKEKTSFSVPNGKYEFNVAAFGLCNAGASYQRLMDMCLSGLPNNRVLAYMDDVIIFDSTLAEHMKSIKDVFERFRCAGISLKASKCQIAFKEIDFLGFKLSSGGIKPQKALTDVILGFDRPSNLKEVKRFMGIVGFYRQFIPSCSKISKPLTRLTSPHVDFVWDDGAEKAFNLLKEKLTSEPVLRFPNFNKPFVVEVDASDFAVGGVLSQKQEDGALHPVAYYSNTLDKGQQKWSVHTKEAYALVLATRHWFSYLMGKPFLLMSDHNPLVFLRKQKDPRGKFSRWIAELEELEYQIQYIPGTLNIKADALSRIKSQSQKQYPNARLEEYIYHIELENENFPTQLRREQDDDLLISSVKEKIKRYEKIDGGRYKRVQKQLRIEKGILTKSGRPVVPASLRSFVVNIFHSTAHLMTDKLYPTVSKRYYWPNMYDYIKSFVAMCETCQQCKADPKAPKAPLLPMFIPEAPMQFMSMDIASLPTDDGGYKYIFLMGDIFSKYIVAVPLQDQLAETVANAIWGNWITVHGCPLYMLSDQGSNVDGGTVRKICQRFAIEKRRSSAYHSQGNGFAERNIRSVREVLRTTLLDRKLPQKSWRSILPELIFALNTSVSSTTKVIPFQVVFGRDPILPEDVKLSGSVNAVIATATKIYAEDVRSKLEDIVPAVREQIVRSQEKMKKNYDKGLKVNTYEEGQKVWLRKKSYKSGETKKLAPRRTGPWTIQKIMDNGLNFRIRLDGSNEEKVVHHNRLTPMFTMKKRRKHRKRKPPLVEGEDLPVPENVPSNYSDTESGEEESEEPGEIEENEVPEEVPNQLGRRYPERLRMPRVIPGAIPWDAIPEDVT